MPPVHLPILTFEIWFEGEKWNWFNFQCFEGHICFPSHFLSVQQPGVPCSLYVLLLLGERASRLLSKIIFLWTHHVFIIFGPYFKAWVNMVFFFFFFIHWRVVEDDIWQVCSVLTLGKLNLQHTQDAEETLLEASRSFAVMCYKLEREQVGEEVSLLYGNRDNL